MCVSKYFLLILSCGLKAFNYLLVFFFIIEDTICTVWSICICSCGDFPSFSIFKIMVISSVENRIPFRLADVIRDIKTGAREFPLLPAVWCAAVLISSNFIGSIFFSKGLFIHSINCFTFFLCKHSHHRHGIKIHI